MSNICITLQDFLNENIYINNHELPEFWYHGTNICFDEFSLEFLGKNFRHSHIGIYFTQYIEPGVYGSTAREYANHVVICKGGKPYIYKCKIHTNNPLIVNSNGWYSSATFIDKHRYDLNQYMLKHNHDCVIAYDFENKEEEGFEYGDYILATFNLDIIEIIDKFEYKN